MSSLSQQQSILQNKKNKWQEDIFFEDELEKKICYTTNSFDEKTIENSSSNVTLDISFDLNFSKTSKRKTAYSSNKQKKIFQCHYENCLKKFKTKNSLQDHIRIHTGDKPFECPWKSCGKRFTQQSSLQKHVRIHKGEKPYKCKFEGCDLAFTQISNLKRHFRIHTHEKPYKCNQLGCTKAFNTSSNLKQHMDTHKNNVSRKKFQCELCKKIYLYSANLKKHKKQNHLEQGNNDQQSYYIEEQEQEEVLSIQNSEQSHGSSITTAPTVISNNTTTLNQIIQNNENDNNNNKEEEVIDEEEKSAENFVESISKQIAQLPIKITSIDPQISQKQEQLQQQNLTNNFQSQTASSQQQIVQQQQQCQQKQISLSQIFNSSTQPIIIKHQDHVDFLINGFLYSYDGKMIQVHQLENSTEFPDQCQQQIQIFQQIQQQQQMQSNQMALKIDDFFSSEEDSACGNSQIECDSCFCQLEDCTNDNFENCLECNNNNENSLMYSSSCNECINEYKYSYSNINQQLQFQNFQQQHKHQLNCGHPMIFHNGHIDYLCDNKLHHQHNDHVDIHGHAEQISVISSQFLKQLQ